jgi:hypothetical protein
VVGYVFQKDVRAYFFEVTVTGTAYLTALENIVIPCINILFSDEDWTVTFNMMGRRIITPPM